MMIGFLAEYERPISPVVPANIQKLLQLFDKIAIEAGIGRDASFADEDFSDVTLMSRAEILSQSDVIVKVTPDYEDQEYQEASTTAIFIGQYAPFTNAELVPHLNELNVNAISLDMIPRTTLAQSMDILSSMASIAGYQSVLQGLSKLPRYAPMMITAAGSIKPSKALVIGAGVAGLQAIATARRMGAMVEAFDTRAAVKEEVQSLGAKFVEVTGATDDKDAGGYAVEQSEDYKQRQAALIQERAIASDLVITTAQLRGRPAPKLISAETVEQMKSGSVIVDLAASTGGNCELTEDRKTMTHHGVTIIGDSSLEDRMPQDASTLYSNNIIQLQKHIVVDGVIDLTSTDEILSSALISSQR
ncbi:MAG: NAD(P) transhydrogenase subunit alpha [Bacteroidota bacterium]